MVFVHDDIYDTQLAAIANNGTRMFLCSAEPTSWTEASATYLLATRSMTPGAGNGFYTIGNATPDGRLLTVLQQAAITVLADGEATHVAICDHVNQKLLLVTELVALDCKAGNTVTINAFTYELPDAEAV